MDRVVTTPSYCIVTYHNYSYVYLGIIQSHTHLATVYLHVHVHTHLGIVQSHLDSHAVASFVSIDFQTSNDDQS